MWDNETVTGEGGTWVLNGYSWQKSTRSRSGDRQNLGAVTPSLLPLFTNVWAIVQRLILKDIARNDHTESDVA